MAAIESHLSLQLLEGGTSKSTYVDTLQQFTLALLILTRELFLIRDNLGDPYGDAIFQIDTVIHRQAWLLSTV